MHIYMSLILFLFYFLPMGRGGEEVKKMSEGRLRIFICAFILCFIGCIFLF